MSATDLSGTVRDMIESAVNAAGAGSEDVGCAVTWAPAQDPAGQRSVAWFILLTMPSMLFNQVPHAVTSDPLICPSLPSGHQVRQVVNAAVPLLRQARQAEKDAAISDASSRAGLN